MRSQAGFVGLGALLVAAFAFMAVTGGTFLALNLTSPDEQGTPLAVQPLNLDNFKPEQQEKPQQSPQKTDTSDWSVYTDAAHGISFKYPTSIAGKPTEEIHPEWQNLSLFRSFIPLGVHDEKDPDARPMYEHGIEFSVNSFADAEYPEPELSKDPEASGAFTYGVDIGGQGGYVYDPTGDVWHQRILSDQTPRTLSWAEFFAELEKYPADEFPHVTTASGHRAYSYMGMAYENSWNGYNIFIPEKKIVIYFSHNDGYVPDSEPQVVKDEIEKDHAAMYAILPEIVKTVTVTP